MLFENRIKLSRTREVRSRCVFKLPFGEEIGANVGGRTTAQGYTASDGVRQKFTGYERDVESGLDYAQARYYAHAQGRFTSPDPLASSASPANPQTFNRYSYVNNSPLTTIDPSGMFGICPGGGQGGFSIGGFVPEEHYTQQQPQQSQQPQGSPAAPGADPSVLTGTVMDPLAAGLRSRLENLTTIKQCSNFLNALLPQLESATGLETRADTFMGVFDELALKGSFYDASGQTAAHGTTNVTPALTTVGINLSKSKPGGEESLEAIGIHETTHAATKWGRGYSEFEIADAAWVVGRRMGLVPEGVGRGINSESKPAYNYNRKLFDSTVIAACGPYPKK